MTSVANGTWPSSRDYVEAIQGPLLCFRDPELQAALPATDKLGMPTVTSGQFAYVFKLNHATGGRAEAVRCFRGSVPGREHRYRLIDDHLDKVGSSCLASFEYYPDGILVRGVTWPTLVMEWIDGHSLDVYLDSVVQKSDVVRYLADMWLKVLRSLRDNGIAHGDLQHGNIIVDRSNMLRLVDLDGMYVPSHLYTSPSPRD
jgi:serine/threonine protein kinase